MLTAAGSPLVAGSVVPVTNTMRKITVIRSFMLNGSATKVGDVLDVSDGVAFEVITSKKAELWTAPPTPPKVEEPEEVSAPSKRSKKDAG